MCGVLGFCDRVGDIRNKRQNLSQALKTLSHRGPDAFGEYYWNQVYFGHKRLSIIDLSSAADQPFHFSNEQVAIVFNGEIYNYKELATTLPPMITSSDTEVILRGYLCYGIDFFEKLRGIFALAIYDYRGDGEIILYRDLAGIKPLYYVNEGTRFAFASEIKAIEKLFSLKPEESVLRSFLAIGYCVEPLTAFKSIRCCQPGECIVFNIKSGLLKSKIINDFVFDVVNKNSKEENRIRTEQLLKQAVKRNMIADVPVSLSLSGGIDSSLVASYSSEFPVKLLSVRFNDSKYDESEVARGYANALGKSLEIIDIEESASIELLNRILLHFDQPYADTSAIPFYFLSKAAAAHGKVLLGGDGGDEVHSGYKSFGWLPFVWNNRSKLRQLDLVAQYMLPGSWKRKWNRIHELANLKRIPDLICEWNSWLPTSTELKGNSVFRFDTNMVFEVFRNEWMSQESRFSSQLSYAYFKKRMLSDYLRKADMMSMLNGLEYRVPMLDEDFVKFSLSIPYYQRADAAKQKKVLRQIHKRRYSGYGSMRPKSGFSMPVDKWLTKSDFSIIRDKLLKKNAVIADFIDPAYIQFLFSSLEENHSESISRAAVYQRIIQLYSFELFCEKF